MRNRSKSVRLQTKIRRELDEVLTIIAKDKGADKDQLIEAVLAAFATQVIELAAAAKGIELDANGNAIKKEDTNDSTQVSEETTKAE